MKKVIVTTLMLLLIGATGLLAQNNCLDFDGDNDYSTSRITTGNTSTAMTWEFWFSFDGTVSGNAFANLYAGAPNPTNPSPSTRRRILPYVSSGVLYVWVTPQTSTDVGQAAITTSANIVADVWYHLKL